MKTSGMVARVRNEVEIHCQLKHPAILEVINLKKFMYLKIFFLINVFQNQNFEKREEKRVKRRPEICLRFAGYRLHVTPCCGKCTRHGGL